MMQTQGPRYNDHELQPSLPSAHVDQQFHLHPPSQSQLQPEQADSDDGQNSADDLDNDDDQHEVTRLGKRKRPISVSCELCKQRKVKCDRGQPSCGWCSRNGAVCEYRERKKPGLRAGYGRELEQRLDSLEDKLRVHAEILQSLTSTTSPVSGHGGNGPGVTHHGAPSAKGSIASMPSDHGTPRDAIPPIFSRPGHDTLRTPQAETALFLQKPTTSLDFGLSTAPGHDSFPAVSGISPPGHIQSAMPPSAAAQEYYGTGHAAQLQSPSTATQNSGHIGSEQELPPYDLLYALVDLYFKHVNTWCPILPCDAYRPGS